MCSTSFFVKERVTANPLILTAGHWVDPANKGRAWSVGCCPGTFLLGGASGSRFNNGDQTDSATITLNAVTGQKAEVYCDAGFNCPNIGIPQWTNNFYVSRVGQLGDGDDVTNAQICDVGRSDSNPADAGNFCGTVTNTNATVSYCAGGGYPAVQLVHTRLAGVTSQGGMSGGAVYARGASTEPLHYNGGCATCGSRKEQWPVHALGIISGRTGDGFLVYTHVQYAQSIFSVDVQLG